MSMGLLAIIISCGGLVTVGAIAAAVYFWMQERGD